MLDKLSGITTFVRELQAVNAYLPMLVTLSGIATLVRPLQLRNAASPMLMTLSGSEMLVSAVAATNAPSPITFKPLPSIVTFVSLAVRLNPYVPIVSTLFGMTTVSR